MSAHVDVCLHNCAWHCKPDEANGRKLMALHCWCTGERARARSIQPSHTAQGSALLDDVVDGLADLLRSRCAPPASSPRCGRCRCQRQAAPAPARRPPRCLPAAACGSARWAAPRPCPRTPACPGCGPPPSTASCVRGVRWGPGWVRTRTSVQRCLPCSARRARRLRPARHQSAPVPAPVPANRRAPAASRAARCR